MTKAFIYEVNGTEIYDIEAFGKGWKKAREIAKREHCGIFRTVVEGENLRYEFYANGGCFLNQRFYKPEKLKIY